MPSFNLPLFTPISSSSPPPSPPLRSPSKMPSSPPTISRPVLSVIQPSSNSVPTRTTSFPFPSSENSTKPLPSTPKIHLRAQSSPPAYLSSIPGSSSTTPAAPPPRRRPLSRRYTRPASLSHLSSRSPLQSHSLPPFSLSAPTSPRLGQTEEVTGPPSSSHEESLFESMLSQALEKKLRERVLMGKRTKGGERMGLGGLKPGRELVLWSALNRCSHRSYSEIGQGGNPEEMRQVGIRVNKSWEESGLSGSRSHGSRRKRSSGGNDSIKIDQLLEEEKRKRKSFDEDSQGQDDDDDDEPLGRMLQEAIEKREKQLVKMRAERAREFEEQRRIKEEEEKKKKKAAEVLDVQVKIRLPASPKPAFLRPLSSGDSNSISTSVPSPPLLSPPTVLDLGPPLFSFSPPSTSTSQLPTRPHPEEPNSSDTKRSKRLRKNPTTSSLPPSPSLPRAPHFSPSSISRLFMSNRSLSLPTVPPRIATPLTSSHPLPTFHNPRPSLTRSRTENVPPSMGTGGGTWNGERNRNISLGMKRSRSCENGPPAREGGGGGRVLQPAF